MSLKTKYQPRKKNIFRKKLGYKKYKLSNRFNNRFNTFLEYSSAITSNSTYKFLDYYYSMNNKKVINQVNKVKFIHKSYYNNINKISNIPLNNFKTNSWVLNQLFLIRENIELGYNSQSVLNYNNKYISYFYYKLFRLKFNVNRPFAKNLNL